MTASLNEKLRTVKWGKYEINQLFKPITIKRKLKGEDVTEKGVFPAYSSDSENNGIVGYYKTPEFVCDSNNPVYVVFGDHTRTMSIARKSFSVLDNVKVLHPYIDSNNALLFIFSIWKRQIPNLGYKRHWSIAKNCILELPVQNGKMDIAFMESFVAELSAYLTVSGLDDYELSNEENDALEVFANNNLFQEYRFDEVFNKIKQGRRLKKEDQLPGDIPFVMSGITNNGVVGYISNPVARFPANSITVDIFGNVFYRKNAFGAGDDTGVYWNDGVSYSEKIMLFFTTTMEKALRGKFSYGKKLRSSQSNAFTMMLPSNNGKPDYRAMELLISAIQKLVIKDVVRYAEQKISATKQITSAE